MNRLVEQSSGELVRTPSVVRGGGGRSDLDRRQRIVLSCATCGGRNYRKTKARREGVAPLQFSKFCSTCNAHTLHREAV